MLMALDTSGPDGITVTMLKQTAVSIASGITKLMTMSTHQGNSLLHGKHSVVQPQKGAITPVCHRSVSL